MAILFKFFSSLITLTVIAGCVTRKDTYMMDFDQDVTLDFGNEGKKDIKRGDKVEVPIKPVFISNTNLDVVALVPVPEKEGSVHVKIPKGMSQQKNQISNLSKDLGQELNQATQAIVEIQQLIAEKRPDEALNHILVLRARQPRFTYLQFLEASCFFLKGDMDRSKELVQQALRQFPNDSTGLAFAKQLGLRVDGANSGVAP